MATDDAHGGFYSKCSVFRILDALATRRGNRDCVERKRDMLHARVSAALIVDEWTSKACLGTKAGGRWPWR